MKKLDQNAQEVQQTSMRELFANNPQRFEQFSLQFPGILFDYSKNRITSETLDILIQEAEEKQLATKIQALLSGEKVNNTEDRPAWHSALRKPFAQMPEEVQTTYQKMTSVVEKVRSKQLRGFTGEPITDVIHLGIGGSDLGPLLAANALQEFASPDLKIHFISYLDRDLLLQQLSTLRPETTLMIVASKSFTTTETLANATLVRDWLIQHAGSVDAIQTQMIALTANPDKAQAWGIAADNIFPLWDWVGGRYSLWSAVGLPVAMAIGMAAFREMLDGAHAMDQHFSIEPFSQNIPVILGLLGVWYQRYFNVQTQAVVPYAPQLELLPNYLQQLCMESLGKSVQIDGVSVNESTGSIFWGGVGTNSQHSFHQLLMQGTETIPVDFILPLKKQWRDDELFTQRAAHCFAQSQALMFGLSAQEIAADVKDEALIAHKVIKGNQPSNTILLDELTPFTFGALIALYEHKVFVQSVMWNINAFDQWGVERGKKIAKTLENEIKNDMLGSNHDASTRGLGHYLLNVHKKVEDVAREN